MSNFVHSRISQVMSMVPILLLLLLLVPVSTQGRTHNTHHHRSHVASITHFGGIGDGNTSNTMAFRTAISNLSKYGSRGGSQLNVPKGLWLTGSFNLTSNFTLYLKKGAVLLASQDFTEWQVMKPLPSYGRGRDASLGRYISLIFGTNLTDVVITGHNATINGQGGKWWQEYKQNNLSYTRPYLIEIMFSSNVTISNLTLLDSPSWNIHPVYSRDVTVSRITIDAPTDSPNTDGINPDSCINTKIIDCHITSGDDCVAVKSGWDEYGISFGMPTKSLRIQRLTCISPTSSAIAIGSEMSGGIQDVRAENITAINTESGVRIKTAVGRGGYVKDVYVRGMTMENMKWAFVIDGNYTAHADDGYNRNALPVVTNINVMDMVGDNVTMAGKLQGILGDPFTNICFSNITVNLAPNAEQEQWKCSNISGRAYAVSPMPCAALRHPVPNGRCNFPVDGYGARA